MKRSAREGRDPRGLPEMELPIVEMLSDGMACRPGWNDLPSCALAAGVLPIHD
jgi:hypothetical protein